MILELLTKWAGIDQADAEVDRHKQHLKIESMRTVTVLSRLGELEKRFVKKSTSFYIGKAMGVIR